MINTLDRDTLVRKITRLEERLKQVEGMLQGQPVGTARIADASIIDAKIDNLSAEKITAGEIDADRIGAGTITATKLDVDKLSAITSLMGDVTVGGALNGDGILKVKNASDVIIVQADKDGHHYYNTSGNELVTVDSTGFHGYNTAGTKQIKIGASTGIEVYGAIGQSLIFKQTSAGAAQAYLGYDSGVPEVVFQSQSTALHLKGQNGVTIETFDAYDINLETGTGNVRINGSIKTAIVPTSKGYNALYTSESPNVWFFDFGTVLYPKWYKFWEKPQYLIDSLFAETIEGVSQILPTADKNIVMVFGIRKGYSKIRMAKKTKEEFEKNNEFWKI